jgi:hypothetical protein
VVFVQREQEQERKDKTEQLRLKCAGQVRHRADFTIGISPDTPFWIHPQQQIADLEQQVMDLTFYTK